MRLFLALPVPAELGAQLLRVAHAALGGALSELKLAQAEDLHLTLHFLGQSPPERVDALARALPPALAGSSALELVLGPSGGFPEEGALRRVLWFAPEPLPLARAQLAQLHARVTSAVVEAGAPLPAEAQFRPHVTIARARPRAGVRCPAGWRELRCALAWRATEVVLYESGRGGSGARYAALARWPLGPN
jgi:2'-5' RNA ligase